MHDADLHVDCLSSRDSLVQLRKHIKQDVLDSMVVGGNYWRPDVAGEFSCFLVDVSEVNPYADILQTEIVPDKIY
jgi:hypothetical protein